MKRRIFFADDGGFSTVGMVLSLLISVSLVLGVTQVYRIRSEAATVQSVADMCALAAEKQVASFYLVAQVCDSVVLSMSLLGLGSIGLGLVAACVPPAESLSVELVNFGKSVLSARNKFSSSCTESLNNIQRLLPVFAAIDAQRVAQANSSASSTDYYALAVLAPLDGVGLVYEESESQNEMLEGIDGSREEIAQAAAKAEEAAEECNEHKKVAYLADCGASPGYCMYERAATLAGMSGSDNPHYASVDAWSFSVALKRARAYYAQRLAQEAPIAPGVDAAAQSAIRKKFYAYACEELEGAYVTEAEDSFSAYFPLFPKNTAEMRSSRLYTDPSYPISSNEEDEAAMHAWDGCPCLAHEQFVRYGSVQEMETEDMRTCPVCQFSAASVGKVAAASTSIDNGFEHHYSIVAQQAALYQQARSTLDQQSEKAKGPAKKLFDTLGELFEEVRGNRIHVQPPGSFGAVAIVVGAHGLPVSDIVPNSLVASTGSLGPTAAISAATLAPDDSDEASTVISSLLDNLVDKSMLAYAPNVALDVWSGLLVAYSNGSDMLVSGVERALDAMPLVGASGLGGWAAGKLEEGIQAVGLEPPLLFAQKPVVVNTYYVAAADTGAFFQGLADAKELAAQAYGALAADPISALASVAGGKVLQQYRSWDATFVIARIELFGDAGPSIPLEIALPPALKDAGEGVIETVLQHLLDLAGQTVEVRRWD